MYDGKVVFEIDAETKSFDAQIEKVEKELGVLLKTYQDVKDRKPYAGQEAQLRGLQAEIEKTNNKLIGLKNTQKSLQQESTKTGIAMDKSFKNGLKSVKKLALGIIGVRSAYMLARRAASAYMSEDEELTEKIKSAWVGLGAFLAPFLEWFSEILLKAVGYLNEFVKALTGNDYIARANAKALEKQAKAQSNLNKEMQKYQQYDFDVIRTQQDMSSYNTGSSSGETSSLIDIPELNEKIVKKLRDLATWLKENKELIEGIGIALGVTFGAVAIGNLLANIGALIGSGALMTGLAGLLAILSVLAIAWEIKIIIDNIDELKEANRIAKEYQERLDKISTKGREQALDTNAPAEVPDYYQNVAGNIEDAIYGYKQAQKDLDFIMETYPILYGFGFVGQAEENALARNEKELKKTVRTTLDLAKAGKLNETGFKNLLLFAGEYGDQIDKLNDDVKDYYISQDELNEVIKKSSYLFPNVINDMDKFGYTQKQITKNNSLLTSSTNESTSSIENLGDSVKNLPTEHNTNITATDNATPTLNWVTNLIKGVPTETNTETKVETEEGEKSLTNWVSKLTHIPTFKTTTIKINAETSELKEKLKKLADVIEFVMPGNMGYIAKNALLRTADYFATGGYVSQPTLAVVGEGRTRGEYMIPDGEDYISRLAAEIGQYSGGNGVTNVYLDGRLIQRQMNQTQQGINFTKNR